MNAPTRRPTERPLPREALEPLPSLLAARLDGKAEQAAHAEAVARLTEASAAVARGDRALRQAQEQDATAERDAVRESKPLPKAKAPRAAQALEEAQRRRDVASSLLDEAVRDLVAAGRPHAGQAAAEAEARAEAELDAVVAAVREAQAAIGRAGEASAAAGWLAVYAAGPVSAWRPGAHAPLAIDATGDLEAALVHLEEARARRRQWREERERDRAFVREEAARAEVVATRAAATYTEEPGRPEQEDER